MPSDEEILVRIDALLAQTADALTEFLVDVVVAEVEREWRDALTAAADFAALAVSDEPSEQEVEEVQDRTTEAIFLAALLMLLLMGVRNEQAQAVALGLSTPGSVASSAITGRLRTLRQIISARVIDAFGRAVAAGATRGDALDKALKEAKNSARIFAEVEALAAVNGGIDSLGNYLEQRGFTVTKTWRTRMDKKVRETHFRAEGQEVPNSAYFSVGGWPMQYPGDRNAPPDLWVNCRCIMVLGSPSPLSGLGS